MKKFEAVILILVLLLFLFPLQCYSAGIKITEVSDQKLVIDGKDVKLGSVVLSMNGVLMVPLREFLTGIGIPDNSKYINWNSKNKTVTINWNNKKISMKLGGKTAVVDGKSVAMDSFCISYIKNRKIYVPLNFTAQLLGKKIIIDDSIKTAYICDSKVFDNNLTLLKLINEAMNKLAKLKTETGMKLVLDGGGNNAAFNIGIMEEIDIPGKKLHSMVNIPLFGVDVNLETFYYDNSIYTSNPYTGSWNITRLIGHKFNQLISESTDITMINKFDVLAACMNNTADLISGKLVLKGITYPKKLIESIAANCEVKQLEPQTYYVEAYIDDMSKLVEKLHIEIKGSCKVDGVLTNADISINMIYKEANGSFEVQTPEW